MNTTRHYVTVETLPPLYSQIQFDSYEINTDVRLVPTLRNFFFSRKPNHAERFYDKGFDQKLRSVITSFEPEIIQLESLYLATYIPAIREVTRALVSLRLHNIEYQIWERLANDFSTSFKKFYLRDLAARIKRFEQAAWQQADVLLAITEADAKVVNSCLAEKPVWVVPFGISRHVNPDKSASERWVAYHLGAMDWIPNAEAMTWFLEDVWPELHRELPHLKFYFAGRNMPGSFQKYEKDGVECAGEVPDADEFIADKKILVVPLKSAGGIRIKILEAMAAGKVVVSTKIGMQGIEGATNRIHFLAAETPPEFIDAIKWVIQNKIEAQELANNAAQLVQKKYSQQMIMSELTSRMENLLTSGNLH